MEIAGLYWLRVNIHVPDLPHVSLHHAQQNCDFVLVLYSLDLRNYSSNGELPRHYTGIVLWAVEHLRLGQTDVVNDLCMP
jgi:hypothetical protein